MRGKILKRIALVVLVSFFCSVCWASTSWAWYGGGYGPTTPGTYTFRTEDDADDGNTIAKVVLGGGALLLITYFGKRLLDRAEQQQPVNWQPAQVQPQVQQNQVAPQSFSDAIVPGSYRQPTYPATTAVTAVRTADHVQPVSIPQTREVIRVDASYGLVENKTDRFQKALITDRAGNVVFALELGPRQRLGIGPLPPVVCHVAGYSFQRTYYGEEDRKPYEKEIERDADRRKGVGGWRLELRQKGCKFYR